MNPGRIALALVHAPVLGRRGEVITTAVTNLDIHDIARSARTYGVGRLFLVTPVAGQRQLVERLLEHWDEGHGGRSNPLRREALSRVEMVETLDDAVQRWSAHCGESVLPVLTTAAPQGRLTVGACRELFQERAGMLVFGTGWGLAPELFRPEWPVLEPIKGIDGYNHLSVRAAAAIIVDRLLGRANDGQS